jgi:EAL domain-containing protein (putative c-di-GMP-specific phosphodiesterase class I)
MRRLSNMGFQLSIDDFGTGYSSLAYLKQLPVDEIKIDRSFVSEMDRDENDAVIVRATIDLAHKLGMKVVAEGVESTDVWDLLEMLGCDTAQGYYIRPPLAAEAFDDWLRSREWERQRGSAPLQLLS